MRQDIRELPTIIDGEGEYKTRNNLKVEVYAVKEATSDGVTEFLAKGSLCIPKPSGQGYKYKYNIWHTSGRMFTFAESENDIVGKW